MSADAGTGRLRRTSCDFGGQIEIAAMGIERPATGYTYLCICAGNCQGARLSIVPQAYKH